MGIDETGVSAAPSTPSDGSEGGGGANEGEGDDGLTDGNVDLLPIYIDAGVGAICFIGAIVRIVYWKKGKRKKKFDDTSRSSQVPMKATVYTAPHHVMAPSTDVDEANGGGENVINVAS